MFVDLLNYNEFLYNKKVSILSIWIKFSTNLFSKVIKMQKKIMSQVSSFNLPGFKRRRTYRRRMNHSDQLMI